MKPLSKMNYKSCSINVRGKYCLIVAPFLIYGLYKTPIYRRGFYCFDTSIQHPFRNLMVPTWLLFLLTLFLPLITIYCIQKFAIKCPERTAAELSKFFFGFLVNLSITEMCKHGFGRLRPNTYDCCQLARYCQSATDNIYIDDFVCLNDSYVRILNTRLSFYSGHSSFGSYAGTYLVIYLNQTILRKRPRSFRFFRICLSVILFLGYLFPGFSQWLISWHFISDVLTGWSMGIIYALLTHAFVNHSPCSTLPRAPPLNTVAQIN